MPLLSTTFRTFLFLWILYDHIQNFPLSLDSPMIIDNTLHSHLSRNSSFADVHFPALSKNSISISSSAGIHVSPTTHDADNDPPPLSQDSQPTHHMTARAKADIFKPKAYYSLIVSPYLIPKSALEVILILVCKASMLAEFHALLAQCLQFDLFVFFIILVDFCFPFFSFFSFNLVNLA